MLKIASYSIKYFTNLVSDSRLIEQNSSTSPTTVNREPSNREPTLLPHIAKV